MKTSDMAALVAALWDRVLDITGRNDYNVAVWGTLIWTIGWFWFVCAVYMFIDLTGFPKWALKYKTQPGRNQPVDKSRLMGAIKTAILNQLFVTTPFTIALYRLGKALEMPWKTEDLPTLGIFLRDFAVTVVLEEIGFYYTHRLVHWPPLYKAIHKKHHEWTAPVGVVAIYAHPIEMVLSNLFPFVFGLYVMRAHAFTQYVWFTIAIFTTVTHHSGYHLPFFPSPEFHDFHHLKFNYNYGVTGWLDRLHGTDSLFREMGYNKRDHALLGFTPASTIHKVKKYKETENGHS